MPLASKIQLEAVTACRIDFHHLEGTGADHCSVGWKPPGASSHTLIPAANLRCIDAP